MAALIHDFWSQVQRKVSATQAPGRLKQWLGLMRHPEADRLFTALRSLATAPEVSAVLRDHLGAGEATPFAC